jgi:hypothetical protein
MFDPDLIDQDQARAERDGALKHTDKIVDPWGEIKAFMRIRARAAVVEALLKQLPQFGFRGRHVIPGGPGQRFARCAMCRACTPFGEPEAHYPDCVDGVPGVVPVFYFDWDLLKSKPPRQPPTPGSNATKAFSDPGAR